MKKIRQWLKDVFDPMDFNDVDVFSVVEALNDTTIRKVWVGLVLEELKFINHEVDKRLLSENQYGITDLCARRKAIQDILEMVLSAKRQSKQEIPHNPASKVISDLDRVTV